jgi:hypothetical protein
VTQPDDELDEFGPVAHRGGEESPRVGHRLWPELTGANLDRVLDDERTTHEPRVNVTRVLASFLAAVRAKAG